MGAKIDVQRVNSNRWLASEEQISIKSVHTRPLHDRRAITLAQDASTNARWPRTGGGAGQRGGATTVQSCRGARKVPKTNC